MRTFLLFFTVTPLLFFSSQHDKPIWPKPANPAPFLAARESISRTTAVDLQRILLFSALQL